VHGWQVEVEARSLLTRRVDVLFVLYVIKDGAEK
jgi:hypothetical protein